jgi:hypothetical protein
VLTKNYTLIFELALFATYHIVEVCKDATFRNPIINEEPSSTIEEIPNSSTTIQENIIEPKTLKEDMKIINELETQASSGGLHEEARIDTTPVVTEEKPKTFDLDAMLGTTPVVEQDSSTQETTSDLFKVSPEETIKVEETPIIEQTPIIDPTPTPEINQTPTITTPPQTNNKSIYDTPQAQKPTQQKNKNVKILLFVVLFAVL